jgi:hypothetical protein
MGGVEPSLHGVRPAARCLSDGVATAQGGTRAAAATAQAQTAAAERYMV